MRRLLGGSAFVFACRVGGAGLTFLLQVALARWMGAKELGIYVLAFSWCLLLSTASHLGLLQAALRFIGQSLAHSRPGIARGYVRWSLVTVLAASAVVAGLFVFSVLMLDDRLPGGRVEPFLLAAAIVPVATVVNLLGGVSNAFSWFRLAFLPSNFIRPLMTLLAVAALWRLSDELSAETVMFVQLVVFALLLVGMAAVFLPRFARATGGHKPEYDQRLWLRTAPALLLAALFNNYFAEITMIILGAFLPSADIAVFNAAFRVAMLIAFGVIAVDAIVMPSSAQLHASGRQSDLQRVVARAAQIRFWASLAAAAGFAWFGRDILALFGDEFVRGFDALLLLVLAQLVRAAAGPGAELLAVSGHHRRTLVVFATALVTIAVLLAAFVPRFGIVGAAGAVLLTMLGWNLWLNRLVRTHLGIRPDVVAGLHFLLTGGPRPAPPASH